MKLKPLILVIALISFYMCTYAQEALQYQLPPAEIVKIVDAPLTPSVSMSPDNTSIILIERSSLITIGELSAEELKLAGIRINPAISGPSRQTYNKDFTIMNIDGTNVRQITGLPKNPAMGFPLWCQTEQNSFSQM